MARSTKLVEIRQGRCVIEKVATGRDAKWLENEGHALAFPEVIRISGQDILELRGSRKDVFTLRCSGPYGDTRRCGLGGVLGDVLSVVHARAGAGYAWSLLAPVMPRERWIAEWVERRRKRILAWTRSLTYEKVISVGSSLEAATRVIADRGGGPSLCHGDIRMENLRESSGRVYLVDWEFAHYGCPARDVARCREMLPAGEWANFTDRYSAKQRVKADLLDAWCLLDSLGALACWVVRGSSDMAQKAGRRLVESLR